MPKGVSMQSGPPTQQRRADCGTLVISLDFELHWGVRDLAPPDGAYRAQVLGAWQAIPRMLDLFAEFDIAVTWATVGFLFARSRRQLEQFSPTLKPAYAEPALSPYQEPVGVSTADDRFHYAPSLIALIRRYPRQEIGTHTFSHYYCLEPGQSREAFQADLASAVAIAAANGIKLRSIVFPRNQFNPDYADILLDAGIVCYRGNETQWMYNGAAVREKQRLARRGARLLDSYLNLSGFHLSDWRALRQPNGLCNIPSSRFLRAYSPGLRAFQTLHLKRIGNGIRAAARTGKIFHLWWHPEDFGTHIDENLALLHRVLEVFADCRSQYGMQSLTMADIGQRVYEQVPLRQVAATAAL